MHKVLIVALCTASDLEVMDIEKVVLEYRANGMVSSTPRRPAGQQGMWRICSPSAAWLRMAAYGQLHGMYCQLPSSSN